MKMHAFVLVMTIITSSLVLFPSLSDVVAALKCEIVVLKDLVKLLAE